jgi:signal transduction histidine kinase
MPARHCILGCHNFHREVDAAIAAEGWTDVSAVAFPARCGRPPLSWDELRALLPDDCGQLAVFGRACLQGLGDPPAGFPPIRLMPQQQCFNIVADPCLVNEAIGEGGYLLTPAWLANWRERIADMGFTPETAGGFFQDFSRKLVLLDTGIDVEAKARLAELAGVVGLPAKRIAVGLDRIRTLLKTVVLDGRLDQERRLRADAERHYKRELADRVSAMDLLAQLAKAREEAEAIAAIEDVFRMLFAPDAWHYLQVEQEQPLADPRVPDEVFAALGELRSPWAWTPSGKGFMLRIAHGERCLGLIAVDGFAFPEHRERYLNLALAISGVCALAIDNARTHKRLVEAERMASLAVLVAGVAHEINTPVGVGLAAASILEKQSASIALRFSERHMTQSDLSSYLSAAQEEAGLIRSNLERIGTLIDAFRQVAVQGRLPEKRRFRVGAMFRDILATQGEQLAARNVEVALDCDDSLEIESVAADWASILSNLVANSLQHGFRNRDRGRIAIDVAATATQLRIDYADDGGGMKATARARIFDPFFTTDMQNGMGLGMHLVYNLVTHRFGGSITCTSEPDKGAQFHIEVPL